MPTTDTKNVISVQNPYFYIRPTQQSASSCASLSGQFDMKPLVGNWRANASEDSRLASIMMSSIILLESLFSRRISTIN